MISFANKVLEVARHLWDLVKFDMVVDDYNIGQTHSVGVIISPFTEALIGTLLLLRSCLELASSDDPSSHGNTSFASFASSSSSASFTRNLSSKFDTARSKNSHGSNIQTQDSNRRKQLMNKLHLPQLSPTQLNAVLDGKSIKKDKSWFDCIEDILDFLHSIMLLFHEQTHSHSQPESHSTSMMLLIQNISPSVLDLIQTLSQLQTHLATSSSSQVVVEVDSMNLPLLQSRGKYHYANLLGMIMHPSINYSQRSKSIKVLTSLLARDR